MCVCLKGGGERVGVNGDSKAEIEMEWDKSKARERERDSILLTICDDFIQN